jgi:hypothetical protein
LHRAASTCGSVQVISVTQNPRVTAVLTCSRSRPFTATAHYPGAPIIRAGIGAFLESLPGSEPARFSGKACRCREAEPNNSSRSERARSVPRDRDRGRGAIPGLSGCRSLYQGALPFAINCLLFRKGHAMRKRIPRLICAFIVAALSGRAELLEVDLSIFGMD